MKQFQLLMLAGLLTGCVTGGMLPGKIYSEQGRVLEFQIEKARRSGNVTAYDPASGEQFSGTYTGILPSAQMTSTGISQVGQSIAVGSRNAFVSTNIANTAAYLKGDKGSMLTCEMTIEAGLSPHGIGTCVDQANGRYRLNSNPQCFWITPFLGD
ncbi:MAG: hypothetical protein R3D69_00355 [Xanthobacteraceae bacterium]